MLYVALQGLKILLPA